MPKNTALTTKQNVSYVCVDHNAMQLTCVVDKEIHCTDNAYLAQLLHVPSCERVFSYQDRADVSSAQQRFVAPEQLRR
jgi:hypothetical protein